MGRDRRQERPLKLGKGWSASSPPGLGRQSVGQEGAELGCPREPLDADAVAGEEEVEPEDDFLEVFDISDDDDMGVVGKGHDDANVEDGA